MSGYYRKIWYLPILICLALVFVLMMASPVSADDGQPADSPTVEEVSAPPQTDAPPQVEEPALSVDPQPVVESAPVDQPVSVEEPAPQGDTPPVEEPAPVEGPTVQEVTTAVADAGLVLVDSTGTSTPMATRDTSLGVVKGDPYFTVGSVTYKFMKLGGCLGLTNCIESSTPIQEALDYMADHNLTPTDRKLYIEADTYNEDVFIGGWINGVKGLLALVGKGNTPDDVTVNGSISVYNMPAGFTIQNMSVFYNYTDGAAIYFEGNKGTVQLVDVNASAGGTDGIGVVVTAHQGNVELNRVKANNNAYHGAVLDVWSSTGSVKVTNSEFNNNLWDVDDGWAQFDGWWDDGDVYHQDPAYSGLFIWPSGGPVTLNGIQVSDNRGYGADLWTWGSTVTVKSSVFNHNDWTGLSVGGNFLTLDHILASDNGANGIYSYINTSLTGTNLYLENNGWDGLFVDACNDWDDNGTCNILGTGTVTLKQSSSTNNGESGFDVTSKGAITIADTFIANNGESGYYLDNSMATVPAAITLTNTNAYSNRYHGFEIITRGAVTMTNFGAGDNYVDGVNIVNVWTSAAVTLTNIGDVFNNTSNNGGDGFNILSRGPVTVTNVDSMNNRRFGGYIDNSSAVAAAPVTLKVNVPIETVNGFSENGEGGLIIYSKGMVTVTNVRASDNSINYGGIEYGEQWFDNLNNNQTWFFTANALDDVTINVNSINFTPFISVSFIDGDGNWNEIGFASGTDGAASLSLEDLDAGDYGIQIFPDQPWNISAYDISLVDDNNIPSSLDVNASDANGIFIDNSIGNAPVSVTNGTKVWNGNNSGTGVIVLSKGLVTLTNMDLNDNRQNGLFVNNISTTGTAGVTLTGVSFTSNDLNGADIFSKGTLLLTNIYAQDNYGDGVNLDNSAGTAGVTIAVSDTNSGNYFDNNYGDGLTILTKGAVTLTNVDANSNYSNGLFINNLGGTAAVTIKESGRWGNFYSQNGQNGLTIFSRGAVTVTFMQANENGWSGIFIDASNGTGAVTLTGNANRGGEVVRNGNDIGDNGVTILSQGSITLTRINAHENYSNGALLNNLAGAGSVTITDGYFDNNYIGLSVDSHGAVIWKNGSAAGNGNYGARLINSSVTIGKPVTISNVYASNNSETGLYIDSKGAVTITNTEASNNSANYYVIEYGQQWLDNLNDDQTWIFDAQSGDDVTITVNSSNFNPSVTVFDLDWNPISYADGSDGTVELSLSDLADGEYFIRINTNQGWNAYAYDISIYEGDTEPTWDVEESYANGMFIDNRFGSNAPVSITNTSPMWNGNNGASNYYILASGAVTLTNLDLNDSREDGLYIDNSYNNGSGAVTLTNVNFFENDGNGVEIFSNGSVVIKTSSSGGSGGYGYSIDNTGKSGSVTMTSVNIDRTGHDAINIHSNGAVTLTNVFQNESGHSGIVVFTNGAVIFNKVDAQRNNDFGAYVDTNSTFTLLKPATGLGYNNFNENDMGGLYVEATGKITVAQVRANDNGRRNDEGIIVVYADGVNLNNDENTLGTAPIALTNVITQGNTKDGLYITTTSSVTITSARAEGNIGFGIRLLQGSGPVLAPVITLTDITTNNNGMDGLYVDVLGNIMVNKLGSMMNGGSGANLINNTGRGTVTVLSTKGANFVGFNGEIGLFINSSGAVSVTGVEALGNSGDGVVVGTEPSPAAVVTLNSILSRNNGLRDEDGETINFAHGISVYSLGVVTINSSWSLGNTFDGIDIVSGNNVFINNTSAINNNRDGIYVWLVDSTKTLKLTGSTWLGNLRRPESGDKNLDCNVPPVIL